METDIISQAYVGFYHSPLVWCAEKPSEDIRRQGAVEDVLRIVHEGTLDCGIRFRVRRDGFIWFDCNNWEPGKYTRIPGWSNPKMIVPKEVIDAEKTAETRAYNRSILINAYQLCLCTSHLLVRYRGTNLGDPVESTHVVPLNDFSNPIYLLYPYPVEPYPIYINNALELIFRRDKKAFDIRQLIELDVIEYSFKILGEILQSKNKNALKIAEILYWASRHYTENAFSESLILSWAVCEKLIGHLWGDFIKSKKESIEGLERMNRARIEKLEGRDFTASIVTEVMELIGLLPLKLFRSLNDARSKRNAWLHKLATITDKDASNSLFAATELFRIATGVSLKPSLHRVAPGTGGVPPHMYDFNTDKRGHR
jgi:hypothetical protein